MVLAVVLDMLLVVDGGLGDPDLEDHPVSLPHPVPAVRASVEAEEIVPCSVMCQPSMPNTSGCGGETAGIGNILVVFLDFDILLWS